MNPMRIGPAGYMGGSFDPAVNTFLEQQRALSAAAAQQQAGFKHERQMQTSQQQFTAQQQQLGRQHEAEMEARRQQFAAQQSQMEREYMTFHQKLIQEHQMRMAQFEKDSRRSWYEMLKSDIEKENEKNARLRAEALKLTEFQSSLETASALAQISAAKFKTNRQTELDGLLNQLTTEWSNKQTIMEGLRQAADKYAQTQASTPLGDLSYWESKIIDNKPLTSSALMDKIDEFISNLTEGIATFNTLDVLMNSPSANPMDLARGLIAVEAARRYLTELKSNFENSPRAELNQSAPAVDSALWMLNNFETKARGYAPVNAPTREAFNLLDNTGLMATLDEARRKHNLATEEGLRDLLNQQVLSIRGKELELGYVSPQEKQTLESLAYASRKQVLRSMIAVTEGLVPQEELEKIIDQAYASVQMQPQAPLPKEREAKPFSKQDIEARLAAGQTPRQILAEKKKFLEEQKSSKEAERLKLSQQRRALLEERRRAYKKGD